MNGLFGKVKELNLEIGNIKLPGLPAFKGRNFLKKMPRKKTTKKTKYYCNVFISKDAGICFCYPYKDYTKYYKTKPYTPNQKTHNNSFVEMYKRVKATITSNSGASVYLSEYSLSKPKNSVKNPAILAIV